MIQDWKTITPNAEQAKRIEEVKAYFEAKRKPIIEAERSVFDHYMDCMDDYSYMGLTTQAHNSELREIDSAESAMIERILRGGYIVRNEKSNILCDMCGNVVSTKIVDGMYGRCWIIENGDGVKFVGCAKKQSTYAKKGYQMFVVEREYKVVNDADITILNEVKTLSTELHYTGRYTEIYNRNAR